MNTLAWKLLEKMLKSREFYNVKVEKTSFGTTIVDAGINTRGGFQAGKIIAEISMGGCGKTELSHISYDENLVLPAISVYTDHPSIATLASQFAGWRIKYRDYSAIGSGPARALALKPKEIYEKIGYRDHAEKAVLILETEKKPPENVIREIAEECNVSMKNLAIILTPTTSIAGVVQVSARIVETGIHKLKMLGLNPNNVLFASGYAPIPPVHPKFEKAIAVTNDAILYGGIFQCTVSYKDDEEKLRQIVDKAPSKSSDAYGKPFFEIFRNAKYDFYKIDPNLFAPALIIVNNSETGSVFKAGKINIKILKESLGFHS